ncbi:Litaf-like zinc finger domain-containing [Fusarium albosuccineum]|uniref:Litaf-like zinc finger domain-containing n=1 Tax=Fusarium albosuccineum TaxID=1237068 RepID=A0A8H4KZN4_9HYPO|nr:Litaf-like zinc finger domain-containing [Fusarium albosuccineum]
MSINTFTKPRSRTMWSDTSSESDNKIELFAPGQSKQNNDITAFDTISPSNAIPIRKLKQWPRPVMCPACRELSITRVERKVCNGTHAMAALMFVCTVVGGPIVYMSKAFKNVEHYCCRCNRRLATFHFNTGTEIHVY